jgi:hypothetical protein
VAVEGVRATEATRRVEPDARVAGCASECLGVRVEALAEALATPVGAQVEAFELARAALLRRIATVPTTAPPASATQKRACPPP